MKLEDYKDYKPEFRLEEYFDGEIVAHGVFENRRNKVVNAFKAHLNGTFDGKEINLEEEFIYHTGQVQNRAWRIEVLSNNRYVGHANGVIGTAPGQVCGSAFNWKYVFDMPVGEKSYHLNFDDWMFLQPDGIMINRVFISKFGINLGNITMTYRKL